MILPERFTAIGSEKFGNEVCRRSTVTDQVVGINGQNHVPGGSEYFAAVKKFIPQTEGLNKGGYILIGKTTDSTDFNRDCFSRHIADYKFTCFIISEYRAENSIMGKHCFECTFQPDRVNCSFTKLQPDKVILTGLLRRIELGIIKIGLVRNGKLIPFQRFAIQRIEINQFFIRQPCGNLPRGFPGINILIIHLK